MKRRVIFRRAESYVREYRQVERDQIRLRRLSLKAPFTKFYIPPEPKLAFIIRIRGFALHSN